jgi:RHS repeat-associated protein
MTSTTDRDGRLRNFSYDALNRETGQTWIVSGSTVNTQTFTFDAQGNQLTAADTNGAYTMVYDSLNRMTSEQEPFGQTLTFTFDAASNRYVLQDSLGGTTTSTYDALNRLTERQFGGSGQTPLHVNLTWTARDQLNTATRYKDQGGTSLAGTTTYQYDTAMRLTNLQHTDSTGNNIGSYVYNYDPGNRLTGETDNGTTTSYQYDTDSELTQAGTATYGYDANGNRKNTGYTTGTGNELTNDGTWTYTYDNEGNLTKKSKGASAETWTYGYDSLNHLVSAKDAATDGGTTLTLVTYVYDVLGNRIEEDAWTQSGGTTTVSRYAYDGSNVWADLTGSNALVMRRLYLDGVDQPFARIDAAGNAGWYLQDHLGSARDIENYAGTMVLDHMDYDGYGTIANETKPANGDRYKYTAREFDPYTGLQYNRARYYDPRVGRWNSQDPLGFSAGDTNVYRYVGNGPVDATDPSGCSPPSANAWAVAPPDNAAYVTFSVSHGLFGMMGSPVGTGTNGPWLDRAGHYSIVTIYGRNGATNCCNTPFAFSSAPDVLHAGTLITEFQNLTTGGSYKATIRISAHFYKSTGIQALPGLTLYQSDSDGRAERALWSARWRPGAGSSYSNGDFASATLYVDFTYWPYCDWQTPPSHGTLLHLRPTISFTGPDATEVSVSSHERILEITRREDP